MNDSAVSEPVAPGLGPLRVRPGSVGAWVLAARPATLTAALVPVIVGTACAYRSGMQSWGPAVAALLGAFLLQIGCNLANDVFDFERGADAEGRLGPTRAAQAGLLTPGALRRGMLVTFALALLVGAYLVWVAGPWLIAIGLCSIAAAVGYTGGPYPFGYHGFGDLFVFLFFGMVAVCGTSFVLTGEVPELAILASLPVGALATAILVVNNVRDRETDVLAGKRTLPVRFGRRFGELEYAGLLLIAYGTPTWLAASGALGLGALAPWLTLPLALGLLRSLRVEHGRALNPVLVGTARLHLLHGALFGAGIFASLP